MTRLTQLLLALLAIATCACGDNAEPTLAANETSMPAPARQLDLDKWHYVEVDSTKAMWGEFDDPEWLRYFGLAAGDLNGDGALDLVSGRTVYFSPGGDLTGEWEKVDLGVNVDANLILNLNSYDFPVILGESLPDVRLFGIDEEEGIIDGGVVAQVPPTGHHNGQGYKAVELDEMNGEVEIIYASQGGLYVLEPSQERPWKVTLVGKDASDEGVGVADMDGDGDQDLIAGYRVPGADAEVPTVVVWFENPGAITEDWTRHPVGETEFATDRVEAADLNGDGRADVVVAEERYPGLEPDAHLWAFLQTDTGFVRRNIVTQFSMNNLAIRDFDKDGDMDIVTAEHKGEELAVQIWENRDGQGNFSKHVVDTGKESHLGTQPYDLDNDGDLDLVSIGWDKHKFVHVWRNDAVGGEGK